MSVYGKNLSLAAGLALAVFAVGCGDKGAAPKGGDKGTTPKGEAPKAGGTEKGAAKSGDAHDHAANLVEVGAYHVMLEVHADEGELDVGFETHDGHKPVALPLAGFTAQVKVDGGAFQEVKFVPADPKERPKDEKAGTASKFSGKVTGLKDAKNIYLAAKIPIDGKEETVEFKDVDPKAAAHKH